MTSPLRRSTRTSLNSLKLGYDEIPLKYELEARKRRSKATDEETSPKVMKNGVEDYIDNVQREREVYPGLPQVSDTTVLNAFFDSQRGSFNTQQTLGLAPVGPELTPVSVAHIAAVSDKEMSVKEALAQHLRNYRVRMIKSKKSKESPTNSTVTATENGASPPLLPVSVQELISNYTSSDESIPIIEGDSEVQNISIEEILSNISEYANNNTRGRFVPSLPESGKDEPETQLMTIHSYPLPPFWKSDPKISRGSREKGNYFIKGAPYVPITQILHQGSFTVPLHEALTFQCEGCLLRTCLLELLLSHGIAIDSSAPSLELEEFFTNSVFLIHQSIVEHLSAFLSVEPKRNPVIVLSMEIPPFAAYNPYFYKNSIGKSFGSCLIFDSTLGQSLVFNDPTPVLTSQEEKKRFSVSYPCDINVPVPIMKSDLPNGAFQHLFLNQDMNLNPQTSTYVAPIQGPCDINTPVKPNRRRSKVRRTSYVGLNVMMWDFFDGCRMSGIVVNGKQLKEKAMLYAKQLGIETFKGSEGWLDAFKRRHKIDLKTMSGVPVTYEETEECEEEEPRRDPPFPVSNDGMTAALLNCVEQATTANFGVAQHLNLMNYSVTDGQKTLVNDIPTPTEAHLTPQDTPTLQTAITSAFVDEKGLIADVLKSAVVRISDKEVSSALETIRAFILKNDPSAITTLLHLQVRLANIPSKENGVPNM